jgi:hypothetical protein
MDLGRNGQAKSSRNPWQVIGLAIAAIATVAAVWFASNAGPVGGQLAAKPQANAPLLAYDRLDAIEAHSAAIASTGVCRAISANTGFSVNVACPALSVPSGLLSGKAADDIAVVPNSADASQAQSGLYAGSLPLCHAVSQTSGLVYSFPCSTAAGVPQVSVAAPTMTQPALEAKAAMLLAQARAQVQADVSRYPYQYTQAPSSPSGTFHAGNPAVGEQITLLPGWKTIDIPARRDRVGGP